MAAQWRVLWGLGLVVAGAAILWAVTADAERPEPDEVDRDSDSSFPASDPPSWSPSSATAAS